MSADKIHIRTKGSQLPVGGREPWGGDNGSDIQIHCVVEIPIGKWGKALIDFIVDYFQWFFDAIKISSISSSKA